MHDRIAFQVALLCLALCFLYCILDIKFTLQELEASNKNRRRSLRRHRKKLEKKKLLVEEISKTLAAIEGSHCKHSLADASVAQAVKEKEIGFCSEAVAEAITLSTELIGRSSPVQTDTADANTNACSNQLDSSVKSSVLEIKGNMEESLTGDERQTKQQLRIKKKAMQVSGGATNLIIFLPQKTSWALHRHSSFRSTAVFFAEVIHSDASPLHFDNLQSSHVSRYTFSPFIFFSNEISR